MYTTVPGPESEPMRLASQVAVLETAAAIKTPPLRWHLITRLAFRFWATYFTLYIVATQMIFSMIPLPFAPLLGQVQIAALRGVTTWVATAVFSFPKPLIYMSGSGDKPYDYALAAFLLTLSTVTTIVWSLLARRRGSHAGLHKWFRVFLRFGLGATMVSYGFAKAFPLQMSYPTLMRLLEPYGHFSLMGVLWAKIGASPPYETFTGLVELTAGILLFIPGLTTAGALVSLVATTQIFMLNMTYDVPVKLFSLHLILMSLMLLAPEAKRLFNVLVLNRAAGPSTAPPLLHSRRGQQIAVAAQLVVAAGILGVAFTSSFQSYRTRGPNAPKPPLYGIWTVEMMTIDGVERAPLVTDYDRWRRVIVQNATGMAFQRMDDTFSLYGAKVDTAAKTIALVRGGPAPGAQSTPTPAGRLAYDHPAPERLILDGDMDGRKVRMELRSFDRSSFRLVQARFRWIQDVPFNR